MKREKYNTNSKNAIMDSIKSYGKSFTAKDIYDDLNGKVGLTTIYRFIEEKEKEEELKKFYNEKNVAYYEYLDHCDSLNHFYLKCNNCGNLIHIDCDCIFEIGKHILDDHGFSIDNKNIIITGICKSCLGGNK